MSNTQLQLLKDEVQTFQGKLLEGQDKSQLLEQHLELVKLEKHTQNSHFQANPKQAPFHILPEEIWRSIFLEYMDTSQDVHNCYYTHAQWRNLLKPIRTKWLLEQVLPLVRHLLRKSDILQIRVVCKNWSKQVDQFLQNAQHNRTGVFDTATCLANNRHLIVCTVLGAEKGREDCLTQFRTHMIGYPPWRNPFLGGSLQITSKAEDPDLLEFFKHFGHHVHNIELHVKFPNYWNDTDYVLVRRLVYIWKCLKHLQNLRRLRLIVSEYWSMRSGTFNCRQEVRSIFKFTKEHAFPQLPNLEKVFAIFMIKACEKNYGVEAKLITFLKRAFFNLNNRESHIVCNPRTEILCTL